MMYPNNSLYPQRFMNPDDSFKAYLIVDRTYEDVKLVKSLNEKMLNGTATEDEKELWKKDLKGAINKTDIARIRYVIRHIQKLFNLSVTDVDVPEFLTVEYCDYLLQLLNEIKNSKYAIGNNIPLPDRPLNSYEKWNTLENILLQALNYYATLGESVEYANGGLYANNNTLI